jgi:hypothetical protein
MVAASFWTAHLAPLIEAAAPDRIMEIGTESGGHTEWLLRYCRVSRASLDLVDTRPDDRLAALLVQFRAELAFHPLAALHAPPLLPCCDLAVIDSDPNWFTVYHVLQLLFARAIETGAAPPIVLLHNIAWPYGRRDMYRDPGVIPERKPYARRGIVPGQSILSDAGAHGLQFNALHEGGAANGVLTALEDFAASWPTKLALHELPFMGGMGILVPPARASEAVTNALADLLGAASLMRMCADLDQHRARLLVELAERTLTLARRADALRRARARIAWLSGDAGLREVEGDVPFPPNLPSFI